MPTTYIGSPVLSQSITIPVDGDLGSAASADDSAKSLHDMQLFLLQSYGQVMQSTSPIRIHQVNSTSMTIAPISLAIVQELGVWKSLTTATGMAVNIPGAVEGGVLLKNRIYYIYIYSVAGVPTFQISLTPPDVFHLYKSGGFTHKFLGSFPSDFTVDDTIPVFSKNGNLVSIGSSPLLSSTLSGTEASTGIESFLPLYLSGTPVRVKVVMVVNNSGASTNSIAIKSVSGSIGTVVTINPNPCNFTMYLDLVTDTSNKIYYQGGVTDTNISVSFTLAGYSE